MNTNKRSQVVAALLSAARDGDRLVERCTKGQKDRVLWPGLGNRAGLHGFASELLREKYEKGAARLRRKLEALPASAEVVVLQFRATTRDRGAWKAIRTIAVPSRDDTADGAREALEALTGRKVPASAKLRPDPSARGVWAVVGAFPKDRLEPDAVVFLGGIAVGCARDDFESVRLNLK